MQRRLFLTSFAAALGAGSMAQASGRNRVQSGASYPVIVNRDGMAARIDHLVITDGQRAVSLDWNHGAALYDEDRVDLSRVGGLGSIFRTPFRRRWRDGIPAGTVEIIPDRNMLIARVQDASQFAGTQATLGAGDYSWDLPGRFAGAGVPGTGAPAGAIRLGRDGRVLIALPQMKAQV